MGLILGAIGALVGAAVTVSKALAVVGMAVEGLRVVGNGILGIAKALGIVKPERKVEELGDRAMQAEEKGMNPEDYPNYEAWVKAIENDDWGYDPEKNRGINDEEKILKGVEVSTAVTMERFPEISIGDFFSLAGKEQEFFSAERMGEIGKIAANDEENFKNIVNYMTGIEKNHDVIDSTVDVLMDVEKKITPGLNDKEAYRKVASFRLID